jgi:pyruvate dehydrogenase E2 component (dihydrolipoamide acetyltransferase)
MIAFAMPSLGADMEAGTLVEWYKQPGEKLKRGDIIALVETQKGAIEIEVFNDGTLAEIKVEPGQKVPVGTVLAMIAEPGEAAEPAKPARPAAERPPPAAAVAERPAAAVPHPPVPEAKAPAPSEARRLKVTPAASRRVAELGLDLKAVLAGPDGVIGLREVEAAGQAKPAARRPGLDLGEMRKAIAAAMALSHRDIPHYWVSQTIDAEPLFAWLEAENAKRPVATRLLYAVPLIKAVALALRQTPELNGHHVDGAFKPAEEVHLGIAMALRGGGLVAPALADAAGRDIDSLMAALADLVQRARSGRLRSSELTAATATFSNLGEGTSESLMPLIYPPQVAIVGCGSALMRPWVVDGAIVPRRVIEFTVGGDHRVSDGRRASQFLSRLAGLLERPEAL